MTRPLTVALGIEGAPPEVVRPSGAGLPGPAAGGAGRPMRAMTGPAQVPVDLAALGPRNQEQTGEIADGWIGNAFVPETAAAFTAPLAAGAARSGRTLADLDLVIPVSLEITDDVDDAAARHAIAALIELVAQVNAER